MSPVRPLALAAPSELLRRLVDRYAALRSYRDRGTLRVWRAGDLPPLEMPFATVYAAPDRFRFEFLYPHPMPNQPPTRYVVGGDGRRAYLFTAFPEKRTELREFPTLGRAVAAASGISCGCAQTIGRLLLRDVRGMSLAELEGVESRGHSQIGAIRCHRLAGTNAYAGEIELDVDADDLLRRIARRSAGFPVEEVREEIEADPEIGPDAFRLPE